MDTDTASDSEPHLSAGGTHLNTYVSVDTDSEDGGMQLEPPDGELIHFAEDDSDLEFDERIMGVAMEDDRDGKSYSSSYPSPPYSSPFPLPPSPFPLPHIISGINRCVRRRREES
jgi:hypothetical protein